jgi:hypothetical protein
MVVGFDVVSDKYWCIHRMSVKMKKGVKIVRAGGSVESDIDIDLCIICQKSTSQVPFTSEQGRKRILDAAEVRNDEITKRLKLVKGEAYVYHTSNKCYKRYTMKKTWETMTRKQEDHNSREEEDNNDTVKEMNNLSRSESRNPPSERPIL